MDGGGWSGGIFWVRGGERTFLWMSRGRWRGRGAGGIFWVSEGGWTFFMGDWEWVGVGGGIFWVGQSGYSF